MVHISQPDILLNGDDDYFPPPASPQTCHLNIECVCVCVFLSLPRLTVARTRMQRFITRLRPESQNHRPTQSNIKSNTLSVTHVTPYNVSVKCHSLFMFFWGGSNQTASNEQAEPNESSVGQQRSDRRLKLSIAGTTCKYYAILEENDQ